MSLASSSDSTQPRILRIYSVLHQLRSGWGGAFILSAGLDPHGAALSLAANIAGAVSLAIDDDPANLREVVRTGAADFVVTTLDEAIRVIKNEIRKKAPLSVALNALLGPALEEIAERGLAPQLFSSFLPQTPAIESFLPYLQRLGSTLLHFDHEDSEREDLKTAASGPFLSSQSVLHPLSEEHHWTLETFTFQTAADLRLFDARALSRLTPADALRRRWLESAPRLLQRQRPPQRSLWLTSAEAEDLSSPRPA